MSSAVISILSPFVSISLSIVATTTATTTTIATLLRIAVTLPRCPAKPMVFSMAFTHCHRHSSLFLPAAVAAVDAAAIALPAVVAAAVLSSAVARPPRFRSYRRRYRPRRHHRRQGEIENIAACGFEQLHL